MANDELAQEVGAGRELDILIAERLTGQSRLQCRVDPCTRDGEPQFHWGYQHGHDFAPNYSTDEAAAMLIVDKWCEARPAVHQPFILRRLAGVWAAQFHTADGGEWFVEYASTRPLAICRAYLNALEASAPATTNTEAAG